VPRFLQVLVSIIFLTLAAAVSAEEKPVGFLCCNMRSDGSWISDSNYDASGKRVIPVGTPVKVIGYGRHRVKIEIEGKQQAIVNDYSRDLSLEAFAKRYVVPEDPAGKIKAFPKKIQEAISTAGLVKGMTREQVLMSVGYPVSSENHNLESKTWRFWLGTWTDFRVAFDDGDRLINVEADDFTKSRLLVE
jgi:hypothetical protein